MRRWPLLLLLIALLAAPASEAGAQVTATISVEPAALTVDPAQRSFQVRVMVDDVTNQQGLGGYTLVMTYDPAVVRASSVTDSRFVESTGNAVVCPASATDNDEGRLAHLCFTIPILPEPGPQTGEPQALATVNFEPVAEGRTTLDISETSIIDPQGTAIEATTANGQVTVGSAPATSPTQGSASDATEQAGSGEEGESDGGGNTGLYIGLGIAALLAVVLIGAGLALWTRRRTAGS